MASNAQELSTPEEHSYNGVMHQFAKLLTTKATQVHEGRALNPIRAFVVLRALGGSRFLSVLL